MLGKRDRSGDMSPAAVKKAGVVTAFSQPTTAAHVPLPTEHQRPAPATVSFAACQQASAMGHCPICRNLLIERCIMCVGSADQNQNHILFPRSLSPSGCMLTFGRCGCVFHQHCLEPWAMRSETCPVHEVPWEAAAPSYDNLRAMPPPR